MDEFEELCNFRELVFVQITLNEILIDAFSICRRLLRNEILTSLNF